MEVTLNERTPCWEQCMLCVSVRVCGVCPKQIWRVALYRRCSNSLVAPHAPRTIIREHAMKMVDVIPNMQYAKIAPACGKSSS